MAYNEAVESGLVIPLIAGWVGGWIVNYLADVLPDSRRFTRPACRHCNANFSWLDYLTFRNCRACGRGRGLRAWIVQIVSVASLLYFWWTPPKTLGFPLGAILLVYFGVVTVIDFEHRLILHPTSAVGAVLGLGIGTYIQGRLHNDVLTGLGYSLLGGVTGFGIAFLLYQFGRLFTRLRARQMQATGQTPDDEEAFGGGDVFLAGVLGLMLGWPFILRGLTLGILLAGVASILILASQLVRRRYSGNALMSFIAYGPYFILGTFILLYL